MGDEGSRRDKKRDKSTRKGLCKVKETGKDKEKHAHTDRKRERGERQTDRVEIGKQK